jgi:hypothetical protein
MEQVARRVLDRIKSVPTDDGTLTRRDFDFSTGTPNSRTEIASYQTDRPIAIRHQDPFDLSVLAVEEFTTDGTGGNTETFNLSNDIIDSSVVGDNLVLFEGNSEVQPDAVDLGADSFDYTDDGTGNTLTAFYAAGDQALVSIQKVAPNGTPEELFSGDIGQIHRRDQNERPLTMDLQQSPFQAVIPTDYTIEVNVDAPYTAAFKADPDDDGTEVVASNGLVDVPFAGAPSSIPELSDVVRNDMARR